MRIDVRGSQELKDVALAMSRMDKDVRRALRQYAKAEMVKPWMEAVNERASTALERRVIAATTTVAVSDQNVRIQSAAKGRKMSGGLDPRTDYAAVEFGANRNKKTTYTRRGHRVTRRTAMQLRPRRRSGYVFWPAADEMVPRLARLFVQSIVKGTQNIFEGRGF